MILLTIAASIKEAIRFIPHARFSWQADKVRNNICYQNHFASNLCGGEAVDISPELGGTQALDNYKEGQAGVISIVIVHHRQYALRNCRHPHAIASALSLLSLICLGAVVRSYHPWRYK